MNKVTLIGTVTAKPEQYGDALTRLTVVTNEKFKNKAGELQERADFHRCVAFGKRGDVMAQYLDKGSKVAIEGKISYDSYEKDGIKRYTTDIIVFNFEFLPNGKKQQAEPAPVSVAPPAKAEVPDDDLPF